MQLDLQLQEKSAGMESYRCHMPHGAARRPLSWMWISARGKEAKVLIDKAEHLTLPPSSAAFLLSEQSRLLSSSTVQWVTALTRRKQTKEMSSLSAPPLSLQGCPDVSFFPRPCRFSLVDSPSLPLSLSSSSSKRGHHNR